MTRKQAIVQAIEALSAFEGNEEAIALLRDLYAEMPLVHWSDKSVRDTIEQFILDHGRPPTVTDFRRREMPSHPLFKSKYGINLSEWLQINYPQSSDDIEQKKIKATKDFIESYLSIRPRSGDDFDERRSKEVRCWYTIAQYNDCANWSSLLAKLSLPSYATRKRERENPMLKVSVIHDLFED